MSLQRAHFVLTIGIGLVVLALQAVKLFPQHLVLQLMRIQVPQGLLVDVIDSVQLL